MGMDIKGVGKWADSIRALVGTQKIATRFRLEATDAAGKRWVNAIIQPEWFKEILQEFVKKELLGTTGLLYSEFHKRSQSGTRHFPTYRPKALDRLRSEPVGEASRRRSSEYARMMEGEGVRVKKRSAKKWVDMAQGFSALWSAIRANPQYTMQGDDAVAGIGAGSSILGLQLSDYSKLSGSGNIDRSLNSLWLATEYGTGIAKNVGGDQWVRRDGPTKDPDGSGRWWLDGLRDAREGALFEGQEGFHFLHDARTRQPLEMYEQMVRKLLPQYISNALGARRSSVRVAS